MMSGAGGIADLKGFIKVSALCSIALFLTACQTKKAEAPAPRDNSAAIALLQKVNKGAQACWMKSRDKDFRQYKVIPELDTRHGKPRILILSAKATQGLPQYVIEADGTPAQLSTYGPLASEPIAARINEDVSRWRTGNTACSA